MNTWVGWRSVAVAPSPKSHSQPTTEPSGSLLASVNTTESPIVAKVKQGGRVSAAEALELYRHAPTHLLGRMADDIRRRKHPDGVVTYIIDRNVNYTNVCVARCNFCAFYRPVGSSEGYVLGFEEIFRKIDETIEVGGNQLLLQGGHNPDLPIEWYEDLFRAVKARYPDFKLRLAAFDLKTHLVEQKWPSKAHTYVSHAH